MVAKYGTNSHIIIIGIDVGRCSGRLNILDPPFEVETMMPTRYDTVRNTGRAIDRVYHNIPQLTCGLIRWDFLVPYCPKHLYTTGLSDHAPIIVGLTKKNREEGRTLPFPPPFHRIFSLMWRTIFTSRGPHWHGHIIVLTFRTI